MDKKFSESVIWLRILMCAFVVFIHTPFLDSTSNWPQTLHTIIRTAFSSIAVPFFFFTSGYFYFVKLKGNLTLDFYKKQLSKRFYSLLVPYILWNGLTLCSVILTAYIRYNIGEVSHELFLKFINIDYILRSFWNIEEGTTSVNILGNTTSGCYPLLIPLWFLRDLIIISILSPIIWYIIKIGKTVFLILNILFYIGLFWQTTGLSATCLFFFSTGAYCAINKIQISLLCYRHRYISLLISIIIFPIILIYPSDVYLNTLGKSVVSITLLISTLGLSYNIKLKNSYITILSMSSFFIYCFHGFPIYKTSTIHIMNKIINIVPYPLFLGNIMPCILYLVEGLGIIFISFTVYKVLKSVFPKFSMLLCGNR